MMARNGSPGLPPSHVLARQRQEHAVPVPDAAPPTTPVAPDDFSAEREPRPGLDSSIGSQAMDADAEFSEIAFLQKLIKLGCAMWLAEATQPGEPDHARTEFCRPRGWQKAQPEPLERVVQWFRSPTEQFPYTPAICGNMGDHVAVVDSDPKNGGDTENVRALLQELKVRVFAEVTTPSGGKHFYIAGHPDLQTVHSTAENNRLAGFPGVDIQSFGTNVFLPGTFRPKYNGAGYIIEFDDLDALITEGDPEGAERFAAWVADQTASRISGSVPVRERAEFQFDPAPEWDGIPPDERQLKYLDTALKAEATKVSEAQPGGRNDTLNIAALKMGHYVAGAGLDQDQVIEVLERAAIGCGLADEYGGVESARATIRSGLRAGIKTPRAVPPSSQNISTMSHQEFWEATDTLRHVRDFARARRVGPWGLLGVCLARVVAVVTPTVQLPPLVGGNASLNLFVGLIATSGSFKGATEQAAQDAFRLGPIFTTGVGSGEGINHMFAHYDKNAGTVMDRDKVMFSVPEIDTLSALGNRNGTTLLSQLRKAWSGEALTFGYVDKNKAIEVARHSYRLTLVAGIQPGRGRALIEDSDGGTPQRFIWLPTLDPDMPRIKPQEPDQIDLRDIANGWPGGFDLADKITAATTGAGIKPHVLELPEGVAKLIDDNAVDKHRRESTDSALDGHLGLCRIKVAAGLALLHNQRGISPLMWDLSGVVMDVSQQTRAGVEKHLAEQGARANLARGKAEGVRAAASHEASEDTKIQKASRNIMRILGKDTFKGKAAWSDLYREARRDRDYLELGVDALVAVGQVVVHDGERGKTIRVVET